MPETSGQHYDILVAGAGFAGSLSALVLHNLGFKICLLEKGKHPRFAIGESSTPVADMILRNLASEYDLPWLHAFSRYGSWQQAHPGVVCGLKRGFSFFKHSPGKDFTTDANHKHELLVAASTDDIQSDTNWLRSDFDAFLVDKVKEAGITYMDLTEIVSAKRKAVWEFHAAGPGGPLVIHARFLIDASGSTRLSGMLPGVQSGPEHFLTDSFALFSHFNRVPRWTEKLRKAGIPTGDYPYDPDDSALHHILDEGWLWVLRFNNGRTSLGFVLDGGIASLRESKTEDIWNELPEKYPAIHDIMSSCSPAPVPGRIIRTGRLQRKATQCAGPGWAALPNTAGFVDPLFSTGIGHSLSGIQKITGILRRSWNDTAQLQQDLKEYERAVLRELQWIDILIAGCYKTMAHFELFNSWSMLFFAATIAHEERLLRKEPPGYFLGADNPDGWKNVQECYAELLDITGKRQPSGNDVRQFTAKIKERIKPVNTAGLLDPSVKNMYRHTAVSL